MKNKKFLSVLLAILLVFSFVACSNPTETSKGDKKTAKGAKEVVKDKQDDTEKKAKDDKEVAQDDKGDKEDKEDKEDSKDADQEKKAPEAAEKDQDKVFKGRNMNVLCTSEKYKELFDKFTEKTSAQVDFLSMSSGEVISRVKAEGGKPMADLWFGGGLDAFLEAKDDGLLEAYQPEAAKDIRDAYRDKDGYWLSKGATVVGFIVNNDLIEEKGLDMPATWEDLTKPQYKDEVIMSDPSISGTNYALVKGLLDHFGEEKGWEILAGINENIPFYGKRGKDPQEKTVAGEFAIGLIPADKSAFEAAEDHNCTVIYPDAIPWVPEGIAIFKGAENADLAKAFIDFMLEDENLQLLAELDGKDPAQMVKPGLKGFDLGLPEDRLIEEDLSTFGTERQAILDRFLEMAGDRASSNE